MIRALAIVVSVLWSGTAPDVVQVCVDWSPIPAWSAASTVCADAADGSLSFDVPMAPGTGVAMFDLRAVRADGCRSPSGWFGRGEMRNEAGWSCSSSEGGNDAA